MKIYLTEQQFTEYKKFLLNKNKINNIVLVKRVPINFCRYSNSEVGLPFDIYLNEDECNKKNDKLVCYAVSLGQLHPPKGGCLTLPH